jgi:malonate transporter
MLTVFPTVLPVFALIFAGWATRRIGVLGPLAGGELNRFVVWLALPALLFDVVANAHWREIWQPAFVATFGLAAAIVFAATVVLRHRGRHLADASIDGLNAAYANTGFMGFPLALAVLGPAALAPTLIATILTACVLFAVALVLIETGLQAERGGSAGKVTLAVVRAVGKNPLLVSPVLGALVMASGLAIPAPAESFLKLLGGAASPCALIALGLFLAEKREAATPNTRDAALLVTLKLIAQPALSWILATQVFHLSPSLTRTAVLIAALPTGTGPFMVAEFYGREATLTSRTVLVSTVLSLATITAYLSL